MESRISCFFAAIELQVSSEVKNSFHDHITYEIESLKWDDSLLLLTAGCWRDGSRIFNRFLQWYIMVLSWLSQEISNTMTRLLSWQGRLCAVPVPNFAHLYLPTFLVSFRSLLAEQLQLAYRIVRLIKFKWCQIRKKICALYVRSILRFESSLDNSTQLVLHRVNRINKQG